MQDESYRNVIRDYVLREAKPPDKFSHQSRLYHLACEIGEGENYDDDVVYAAAWLHDLGVFIGHRPEDPTKLASWDNVDYAIRRVPSLLREFGFPAGKVAAVVEAIRTHLSSGAPATLEGTLLRDADILEQLGAVGILRIASKVGRDTRFVRFSDALNALEKNLQLLPGKIKLERAKRLAEERVNAMLRFLEAARTEGGSVDW